MDQPQAHPYATYLDIRYPPLDLTTSSMRMRNEDGR